MTGLIMLCAVLVSEHEFLFLALQETVLVTNLPVLENISNASIFEVF